MAATLQACGSQSPRTAAGVASDATSLHCGTLAAAPQYRHILLVLMENHSFGQIYKSRAAPYFTAAAAACGIASDYHSVTHDSLPNYLALTGGAGFAALTPFDQDCAPSPACGVVGDNLFHEASQQGGWKAYAESMPRPCDGHDSGHYAARHNPAVYFADLAPDCSVNDVALGTVEHSPLVGDFSSEATAPAFAFVTPDLCDDMHGGSDCRGDLVERGDRWLRKWLALVTATNVYGGRPDGDFRDVGRG